MNDETYWDLVDYVIASLPKMPGGIPAAWRVHVVERWRHEVAPRKHNEYGIECWERLGPRAVVADLSAVFYRYKKLSSRGPDRKVSFYGDDPEFNAIIDAFGYAVIYVVCKYGPGLKRLTVPLSEIYEIEWEAKRDSVWLLNEELIRVAWDGSMLGYGEALAMRQAYEMFKGTNV